MSCPATSAPTPALVQVDVTDGVARLTGEFYAMAAGGQVIFTCGDQSRVEAGFGRLVW